jgi:hypothetical protein
MGADEELGGSCVAGVGAAPGRGCCVVVPAGGEGCGVVEGGACCVRFCAGTAQGDASSDATTNAETKPVRGLKLLNARRVTSVP